MAFTLTRLYVLCLALQALTLPACGGAGAPAGNGGGPGGAQVPPPQAGTGAFDATACSDACSDAAIVTPDAEQGADAGDGGDAVDTGGAAQATDAGDLCHLSWPEPSGPNGAFIGLGTDPSGNTYAALEYASGFELGAASPSYPSGIAVSKMDPHCDLVWVREFGAAADASGAEFAELNMMVDATSSVTLTGTFVGPVDFGAGPLGGYQVGFVLHLDAGGNVTYLDTYPSVFPTLLGVGTDGSVALLLYDLGAFECSMASGNPAFCDGGNLAEAGSSFTSFVQLDPSGSEVARRSFNYPGASTGLDSSHDLSLDPGGVIWAIDNYADAGPLVERVTEDGVIISSQPTGPGSNLILAPTGAVVFLPNTSTAAEMFELFGLDGGVSWTQDLDGGPLPQSAHDVAADPTGAIYVGGQVSSGPPGANAQSPNNVIGAQTLNPQGQPQGVRRWAAAGEHYYRALGVDPHGNVIIGGESLDLDGGSSYFLVKLGP